VPTRVKNCGEGHNRGSNEAVNNTFNVSLLLLNIHVKLLLVCGPFLMEVIL
jgi:hypothetical protein